MDNATSSIIGLTLAFLLLLMYYTILGELNNLEHDSGFDKDKLAAKLSKKYGILKAYRIIGVVKCCAKFAGYSILAGVILGGVIVFYMAFSENIITDSDSVVFDMTCICFVLGIIFSANTGAVWGGEVDFYERLKEDSDRLLRLLKNLDAGTELTKSKKKWLSECKFISLVDADVLPHSVENLHNAEKALFISPHLTYLPENFGLLKNLKCLMLRNVDMTELPSCITHLEKLEILELESTAINKLPNEIGSLKNLTNLNIRYTQVTELPYTISNCEKLELLAIAGTGIRRLPDGIERLKNLKRLHIDSEQVIAMKNDLNKLKTLEELSIVDTIDFCESLMVFRKVSHDMKVFPDSLGNLKKLKLLKVHGVKSYSLPESIGNLANLEVLDLSHSEIYNLPESIGNLSKLKELLLNDTNIKYLPKRICDLQRLHKINLSYMPLTVIPDEIGKLKELQWMDLSYLRLTTLPGSVMLLGLKLDVRHIPQILLKNSTPDHLVGLSYFWTSFGVPRRRENSAGIYLWNTWVSSPPLEVLKKDRRSLLKYYASQSEDYAAIDGSRWEKIRYEETIMKKIQNINSQIGNQGDGAGAHSTIIQFQNMRDEINLEKLSKELDQIKAFLKSQPESDENEILIGKITEAKKELNEGQESKALEIMAPVGKKLLSIAEKVGCSFLIELIKKIIWP